jgi:O-antigen/teichoic acid export membrane protein
MNEARKHKNFLSDLLWYSLGTIIPILVSLLRTPVFTRYFTPEEFGIYGLVFITFTILSVFMYTWMANAIWRFYFKFKKLNKLSTFYSNLFFLFLAASVIFTLLIIVWILVVRNTLLNRLVLLIFTQTFLSQLVSYLLIIFRLENKSRLYTFVHSFRAIISFGIQCVITFVIGMRIEAIPIATLVTEFLVLAIVIVPVKRLVTIQFTLVSRRILLYLASYFLPGIISNIGTVLLTLSDRYVISHFGTLSEVGIYNQVYNFAQISIVAIISIFVAMISPEFLDVLEQKPDKLKGVLIKYHLIYVFFILPAVVYISMFAEEISYYLFGKEFRVGYTMIPYVAFSYYLSGLTSFRDTKFKFRNRYRIVIIGMIAATVLNIVLNFIFVPVYGYKMAAITTFAAYVFLYLYYQFFDDTFLLSDASFRNKLLLICSVMGVQFIIHLYLKNIYQLHASLLNSLTEGLAYMITYALVLMVFQRETLRQLVVRDNS